MLVSILGAAPTVAVPGLAGVGVEKERAEFYTEHFAQQLRSTGLHIVTQREMSALLGLERQKQLLGCSDAASSCMAELASALGADAVALGDIARLDGGKYQVNLKLLNATTGQVLSTRAGRVEGEEALTDALSRAAYEMGVELLPKLRPGENLAPAVQRDFSRAPLRKLSFIPAVVGVGGFALGAVMLAQAGASHRKLTDPGALPLSSEEGVAVREAGKTQQLVGGICLAVGAVGVAAAAAMFLYKDEAPGLSASFAVTNEGGAFVLGGRF
jgi:hypothetical protein